ncbi:MAG: hypothetical protein A2W01_01440 [Candidatus Solincola sediminis]|uniref:NADH-quinone oxidoreductase subunit D domain-containing protein n=1 Tax=Candidatus Solincola sediminis TaxID=1797199 RepID=A0A1F2WHG3_9ACTN|nr:MAG: hypothetical protein A2Y75_03585 [Candidatus Solincola sediminis]OFW58779.1 MAG: hypothetical protein A2W01_01440 [Candidatus Solincola sediminis]
MSQVPVEWHKLESGNRVWLSGNGSDLKARLEFLAQHGLRLMLVSFEEQSGASLHFSNPIDRETLHIKSTRGPELVLAASQCFPEAAPWLEILGLVEPAAFCSKAGTGFFEEEGRLFEVKAGRLCGIHEVSSEWPRAARGKKPAQAIPFFEENSGNEAMARTIAFLEAVEDARGIRVPVAGAILRTVLLEIERVRSHLSWLERTCSVAGRTGLAMECKVLRKELYQAATSWLGGSSGAGWSVPGGVRDEFPIDAVEAVSESLVGILNKWKRIEKRLISMPLARWLNRRLSSALLDATAEGWVGPLGRAAGLDSDARTEENGVYQLLDSSPIRARTDKGIPEALLEIKVLEVTSSLEVMILLIAEFPGGPLNKKRGGPGKAEGFGRVEGPAGEVCCHVELEKGFLESVVFSSPARFNRSIARAFEGAWLDEIEVASFLWS